MAEKKKPAAKNAKTTAKPAQQPKKEKVVKTAQTTSGEKHPGYEEVLVTCSCGNSFKTRSTVGRKDLHIEICSECHPFYTGQQKVMDTSGRVEKFKQKYAKKKTA